MNMEKQSVTILSLKQESLMLNPIQLSGEGEDGPARNTCNKGSKSNSK